MVEKGSDHLRALLEQRHHTPGRAVPDAEKDHFGRPTVNNAELEKVLVSSEEHRTGFAGQDPNLAVGGAAPI